MGSLSIMTSKSLSEPITLKRRAKRRRKKVPLLIANRAQDALGSDHNAVTLIDDRGRHPLPDAPKLEVARCIVAHLAHLLHSAAAR